MFAGRFRASPAEPIGRGRLLHVAKASGVDLWERGIGWPPLAHVLDYADDGERDPRLQSQRVKSASIGSRSQRYRAPNGWLITATGALRAPSAVTRSRPLRSRPARERPRHGTAITAKTRPSAPPAMASSTPSATSRESQRAGDAQPMPSKAKRAPRASTSPESYRRCSVRYWRALSVL